MLSFLPKFRSRFGVSFLLFIRVLAKSKVVLWSRLLHLPSRVFAIGKVFVVLQICQQSIQRVCFAQVTVEVQYKTKLFVWLCLFQKTTLRFLPCTCKSAARQIQHKVQGLFSNKVLRRATVVRIVGIAQKSVFNNHTCLATCFQNFNKVL